jgi:hypothetical protein
MRPPSVALFVTLSYYCPMLPMFMLCMLCLCYTMYIAYPNNTSALQLQRRYSPIPYCFENFTGLAGNMFIRTVLRTRTHMTELNDISVSAWQWTPFGFLSPGGKRERGEPCPASCTVLVTGTTSSGVCRLSLLNTPRIMLLPLYFTV